MKKSFLTNVLLTVSLSLIAVPLQANPIQPTDKTIVNKNGEIFNIAGGDLSEDGQNLFHSFEVFGLNTGQIANFLSAPDIRNILGRVVGGNPSIINGLIQVTGADSNLFLMNPAGIVFGANASLNVLGDFAATTATGIGFADGWFNAFGENNYQDLIGHPSQFAFDLTGHGAIINDGNLVVNPDKSLALIGSSITNNGVLSASNGRITIASIPGENLVRISHENSLLSLEIIPPRSSQITALDLPKLLTGNEGETNISGTISTVGTVGGEINILGDRIVIENSLIDSSGQHGGGNIRIGGDYQGQGNIPNAKFTYVKEDTLIQANALENSDGGRVIVWSDNMTYFLGRIESKGGTIAGDGGFIEVSGKKILDFQGFVNTTAQNGNKGILLLDPMYYSIQEAASIPNTDMGVINALWGTSLAFSDISFLPKETLESLPSEVIVQADRHILFDLPDLNLLNGLPVTFEAGDTIASLNPLTLSTNSDLTLQASEIHLSNTTLSTNGGNLTVTALNGNIETGSIFTHGGDIALQATGSIATNALDSAPPFTPLVTGDGGEIRAEAGGDITIDGRIRSHAILFGDGGDVHLQANGSILVDAGAGTTGRNGGDFTAIAGGDFTSNANLVTVGDASAGHIAIQTGGDIGNLGLNAATGAFGGNGATIALNAGGNIAIGGAILDSDGGMAGSISATAGGTIRTGTLFARGTVPGGGDIAIASPNNILIEGVIQSDGNVSIATQNSFTITGMMWIGGLEGSILADTVEISTGTPLNFDSLVAGESSIALSIVAGNETIYYSAPLTTDIALPYFQYTYIPPTLPILLPPPTPTPALAPIAITAAPTWAEAIAQTLERPLAIAEVPEAEAIAYSWGDFTLWLPIPRPSTVTRHPSPMTDDAIASIEQIENHFTQQFVKAYPELEERQPIRYTTIRESLEQIHAQTGQEAALLYAWWDVEGLRLGVVRRDRPPVVKTLRMARADVQAEAKRLYETVKNRQPFDSKKLSEWIVSPIAPELKGVDTILTAFDEGLKNIPISLLLNDNEFLIKRFNLATIPSVALMGISSNLKNEKILALGVSEFSYTNPLQFVPLELEKIALYREGNFFLDQDSTVKKIIDYPAPILHLATHASAKIIILHDRIVTIEEFKELTARQVIKLLVLSACEAAFDLPTNEHGFAVLAARANVDSVLASRWRVNDGATALFMEIFYEFLKKHPKGTALRLAQLKYKKRYPHYNHPYYWAGFGLVGSP
ncbi:MAG: CHAT domain-containing protein [Cyanobacteria bacterium SBLK]|nr:CHAT domain-containing protein [Cyanobacteria bacterium SBLK]